MLYHKASLKNGSIVIESSKEIDQSKMTSDCCWAIQFEGLVACKECKNKGHKRLCGGGLTLKAMIEQSESTKGA